MTDSTRAAGVIPRYKLPEHFALSALRQGALADRSTMVADVVSDMPDEHRGRAAAFEAASVALQSYRRLGDAVEMLRRLMSRLERKEADAICSAAWRRGYLHAADEAVEQMQCALAEEPFDSTTDRRSSGEFRFEFSVR